MTHDWHVQAFTLSSKAYLTETSELEQRKIVIFYKKKKKNHLTVPKVAPFPGIFSEFEAIAPRRLTLAGLAISMTCVMAEGGRIGLCGGNSLPDGG